MKFEKNLKNIFYFSLVLISVILLTSCKKDDPVTPNPPDEDPPHKIIERDPAIISVTNYKILENTPYETLVYHFVSNCAGPKIAIVGGIHGDEIAGWNAALDLVEELKKETMMMGEVLLIPQGNIVADNAKSRYKVTGYSFTDLNRSFPAGRADNVNAETLKISEALRTTVEDFDADYIIDLHESLHSWTSMESGTTTSLGDTLISGNQSRFMRQLISHYNKDYKPEEETNFRSEGANQLGSFNYYFTTTYPNKVVFTVETNRGRAGNIDYKPLEDRVRQQKNILQALFDYAWERI